MMISGAKFVNFANTFKRLHGIIDTKQPLEGIEKLRFFKEILVIEERLEILRWDEWAKK